MLENSLLSNLVIIIFIAIVVVYFLRRLRIPPLVGFLIAGALLGPNGFAIIKKASQVNTLAEIGIILLLFSVGLEFPFNEMKRFKNLAVIGGSIQILLTILLTSIFTSFLDFDLYRSIFLGCILSLSSTSLIIKLLSEKGMTASIHGRMSIVLLIFQDLAVIPMLLLLPIFGGETLELNTLMWAFTKIVLFLILIFLLNRYFLNNFFKKIVKTRNSELFVLALVLLCLGMSLIGQQFGISLALGAFIAGALLASSEYSYQMSAHVLPFRSFFESIFFISIGLLLNPIFIQQNILPIFLVLLFIFIGKALICTFVFLLFRYPLSISITAGLLLNQIGEFSFLLAKQGLDMKLIDMHLFQLTVTVSLISMILTPFLFQYAQPLGQWLGNKTFLTFINKFSIPFSEKPPTELINHVVLMGYGTVGKTLGKILKKHQFPTLVIDTHVYNIKNAQGDGFETLFGDSQAPSILEKTNIKKASLVIITFQDPITTENIIKTIRSDNSHIPIIVRANYQQEVEKFQEAGKENIFITYAEIEITIDMLRNTLKALGKDRTTITQDIEHILRESLH